MFNDIVTVFNYHERSKRWYPTVIFNAYIGQSTAGTKSNYSSKDIDDVMLIINCTSDQKIATSTGLKKYISPKEYSNTDHPESCVTFCPAVDFIINGEYSDLRIFTDEDYESGFYHEMNEEFDNVHLINSAAFYKVIPHFEIGGN